MPVRKQIWFALAVTIAFTLAGQAQAAKTQGVSDKEVILGTHMPLSGPLALWGVPASDGQRMRVEEANAKGGVHGRQIKLIVEDNGYQQSKAAQAGDKLLKKDKVFALVGVLGTPMNMVTMDKAVKRGVLNLFPLSAAQEMFEPLHPLKFAFTVPYYDQARAAVKWFVEKKGKKKIAILYQDDDFGLNVAKGARDQVKAMGMKLVSETTYKRGASDFSSQVAKMKAAEADLVILGTVIVETIGAKVTAVKMGWNVDMVITSAGYTTHVPELAKGAATGLYGTSQDLIPYEDTAKGEAKAFVERYKKRYGKAPSYQAAAGYTTMDLTILALEKAGRKLTSDGYGKAVETIKDYKSPFGGEAMDFSATDHLGPPANKGFFLSVVKGTRWELMETIGD